MFAFSCVKKAFSFLAFHKLEEESLGDRKSWWITIRIEIRNEGQINSSPWLSYHTYIVNGKHTYMLRGLDVILHNNWKVASFLSLSLEFKISRLEVQISSYFSKII